MKPRRRTIWRIHSLLGVITGIPLLVIALTGSVLVFAYELDKLRIPEAVSISEPGPKRLGYDSLIREINSQLPEHEVVGWANYRDPTRADFLYLLKHNDPTWMKAYLNQYTGELKTQPAPLEDYFTGWMLKLHYTFFAGHVGMLITGLLAVLLCALGITGIIINRNFWRSFFTLRWKASLRIFMGDIHRKVGIISSPLIFILGITGAWWNITHSLEDLMEHGIEHEEITVSKPHYNTNLSLDRLVDLSSKNLPGFKEHYIALPYTSEGAITLYGQFEDSSPLRSKYGSSVSYDKESGEILSTNDIRKSSVDKQIVDSFEPLHFGSFGGLPVKIIWCVVGLAPAILALSGTWIWLKTRKRGQPTAR